MGNINIGDNVSVGANAVVVCNVPPHSTVVGIPGRVVKQEGRAVAGISLDHTNLPDPISNALQRLQHEIDHIEGEIKHWHHEEKKKREQD